ncbi:hypothetical protein [Bradyrhizobium cenepequi]
MITSEKPHRRNGRGYAVAFWKANMASNEDDADRAIVYAGPPGMPYPEIEFRLPEQRPHMEKLERMLSKVFDRGIEAAKAEIRGVLGVLAR